MVKIRLARAGAKKRPFYHIVATESRSSRDGRFIERLGFYNPIARGGEQKLVLDTARVAHWKAQGAELSERVLHLARQAAAEQPAAAPEAPAGSASETASGEAPAAA